MEVVATAKWVRTTARKARLVAATVEGLPVTDALTILSFTPRAAALDVAKVIKSAAANAEHNYNLEAADLRIARIEIEGASIIKRFRPRAQGRAYSVFKRTTHLRAFVTDEGGPLRPRRRAAATATAAPAPAAAPAERPARRRRPAAATAEAAAEAEVVTATDEETAVPAPKRRRTKAAAAAQPSPADLEGSALAGGDAEDTNESGTQTSDTEAGE